jgi:FtsZ-interacting cell division protein ZipA
VLVACHAAQGGDTPWQPDLSWAATSRQVNVPEARQTAQIMQALHRSAPQEPVQAAWPSTRLKKRLMSSISSAHTECGMG